MRFTSGSIRLGALLAAVLLAGAASTGRAQQGTIAGLVTDQLNNAPVAGARILLGNTNRTAIANTSGRYAFTGVPAGSYELRVVAVGFRALLKVVQVEAGGSATADFALARAVISLDEIVVNPVTGVQRARE